VGREALCQGQLGGESGEVIAHLEANEIRIRGAFNANLRLADLSLVRMEGEALKAESPHGLLFLSLGSREGRKWLDSIANPPALEKKLGLGSGVPVHVVDNSPVVMDALTPTATAMVDLENANLVFITVVSRDDLQMLDGVARKLPKDSHLWVLRKKGKVVPIKESEIMACLRSHGLAPTKTAAWSELYSADRYSRSRSTKIGGAQSGADKKD